jgi:TonB family protein
VSALLASILLAIAAAPAVPTTNPNSWIGPDDYPESSIDSDKEGALTVAIGVDHKGSPTDCKVTAPSGEAPLDSLTCALLMKRAAFKPATDRFGKAINSVYALKVRWQIPREKLIARGFTMTFLLDPNGQMLSCQTVQYRTQDDELKCEPDMIEFFVEKMLPQPLTSYQSVSLTTAAELDQPDIAIPQRVNEDRVVITSALIDVAPTGVVTKCTISIAADWLGEANDLCSSATKVGGKQFATDPQGKTRKFIVKLEVSGLRR